MTGGDDPTAAGFTPPSTGKVTLSLNEIDSLGQKSARGAGMPWGLAEEAGFALRWLAARGIDGSVALLDHLAYIARRNGRTPEPRLAARHFDSVEDAPLCPIRVGTAISDRCLGPEPDAPITVAPVHRPLLLLPFVAALCDDSAIAVTWDGGRVIVSRTWGVSGQAGALAGTTVAAIRLTPAQGTVPAGPSGAPPMDAKTLAALDAYAMQTTVPATAASRAGAGAAADDND